MAMDCTLGDSGQTKGKPVGRCRGWYRPGQTHHGGFQDLVKQRQGCPNVVLGVVLLQGESWIQWPSFKPKFSYLSVFPYRKAQVFWGTQMFLNMLPSNLTRIFYQDLSESQQTNKQHWTSTVILYWQQPHSRFFTLPATELLNPRRAVLVMTSRGASLDSLLQTQSALRSVPSGWHGI